MSLFKAAALVGGLASTVAAHGHVQGMVADGVYYEGYSPSFQYMSSPPEVPGWSCPECLDNGFVSPDAYSTSNITCHKDATPGKAHAAVKAGGTVELQWTAWPDSHHGPVISYLANCNGDCETVDKTKLEFFKIDEGGLIDDTTVPGTWASDKLIANNNSWTVTIPSALASGNYVLRHEIIALHSAGQADGAQNYPQCFNLAVTGTGSDKPTGVLGTALYKETDPGILVNIYASLSSYVIPGPTLISGAATGIQSAAQATATAAASSGAAAAATTAAASSAEVTSAAAAVASSATPSSVAAVAASSSVKACSSVVTPAPSSVEAAGSAVTSYVSQDEYTTVDVAVTVTAAPSVSSVVAPAISAIAHISTAIPSELLTSALPTGIPTGVSNGTGSGTVKPIPANVTLADLLAWIDWILKSWFSDSKKAGKERHHARQFVQ